MTGDGQAAASELNPHQPGAGPYPACSFDTECQEMAERVRNVYRRDK